MLYPLAQAILQVAGWLFALLIVVIVFRRQLAAFAGRLWHHAKVMPREIIQSFHHGHEEDLHE